MAASTNNDLVADFIAELKAELDDAEARGVRPPIERRKLRTVIAACRRRASSQFLKDLTTRLAELGVYANPSLDDSGLRPDDFARFSTAPFEEESVFFRSEKHLMHFVEACLGSNQFRNLSVARKGREYRLRNGRRVDLLCEERRKSGPAGLVAFELKCAHERGVVEQLAGYLELLREEHPNRSVRGIIISGAEDQALAALRHTQLPPDIEWYCYRANLKLVAGGAASAG